MEEVLSAFVEVGADIRDESKEAHRHVACRLKGITKPAKLEVDSGFDIGDTLRFLRPGGRVEWYFADAGCRYLVPAAKTRASPIPPFTSRSASFDQSLLKLRSLLSLLSFCGLLDMKHGYK